MADTGFWKAAEASRWDPRAVYVCSFVAREQRAYAVSYHPAIQRWEYTLDSWRARAIPGGLVGRFLEDHQEFRVAVQQIPSLVKLEHSKVIMKVWRGPGWTEATCRFGTLTQHDGLKVVLEYMGGTERFLTWAAGLRWFDTHLARQGRGG